MGRRMETDGGGGGRAKRDQSRGSWGAHSTFLSVWGRLGAWRYSVRQIPASICDVLQGRSDTDQYVDIVRVEDLPLTEIHKYKNPNASSSIGLDLELQAHKPTSNSWATGLIWESSRLCFLDPVLLPPSSGKLNLPTSILECPFTTGKGGRVGFLEGRR